MTASIKIHEAPFDGDYYVGQTKTDYYTQGGELASDTFCQTLPTPKNASQVSIDPIVNQPRHCVGVEEVTHATLASGNVNPTFRTPS